ncbi:unnamed protein product [Auanema sp. JU1783]|nr:unnamed protein product [Auanema sp. JU1783]
MRISLWFFIGISCTLADDTISRVDETKYSIAKEKKYLIYDVNRGEGFNLRRDVYMRIANSVRTLRESGENFVLVLPPWGGLFHWDRQKTRVPWGTFFDIKSLNEFVPVIEFEQFLEENPTRVIDNVIYLQHYAEGWGTKYELKFEKRDCMDGQKYYKYEKDKQKWAGWFFSFPDVLAKNFECISIQGESRTLTNLIKELYPNTTSIFVDRGETILHEDYGGVDYWKARRSMRYAENLVNEAAKFRKEYLDSEDSADRTILPESWIQESARRDAIGGPYICAHWRRRDFVRAHGKNLPSIKGTSKILNELAKKHKVGKVFLATDAEPHELEELKKTMNVETLTYKNLDLSDGEIAVVDQIICSHARYFTGSHVSTFSYRIQEDREILGFKPETTFNRMCGDKEKDCEQPSKWKITH